MFPSLARAIVRAYRGSATFSTVTTRRQLACTGLSPHAAPLSPPPPLAPPPASLFRLPVSAPGLWLPLRLPPPPAQPPPPQQPPTNDVTAPGTGDAARREAARLIIIRRRKMRKHKLKKLRKRMRFVFAKIQQRRATKKEKAFQAEQMALVSAAARFDAREYVDRAIERAETMPMATRFGGKRLPYFIRLELEKDRMIKYPKK